MKKEKRTWKFFVWNTLLIIVVSCVLNTIIWIAFHGVPLIGLPKKEEVESITIIYNDIEERKITDDENIELLVKAANFLNYQLWGKKEDTPIIVVTYHLKNGENVSVEANSTTMWWHNKSHSLKETDTFVKIIQGLFFN